MKKLGFCIDNFDKNTGGLYYSYTSLLKYYSELFVIKKIYLRNNSNPFLNIINYIKSIDNIIKQDIIITHGFFSLYTLTSVVLKRFLVLDYIFILIIC